MSKLVIKNLHVQAEDKKILKGINIEFETGKVYAIIGPNGNGKSTLLSSIMGDPNFEVTQGEVLFDGEDVLAMEVDQRARKGIFLAMQYPSEIAGVSNVNLMKTSLEKVTGKEHSLLSTFAQMQQEIKSLRINEEMIEREVNVGFSGGEKKKNELLHMSLLKPKFALLDEIDSGLDVDSIQAIGDLIKKQKSPDRSFIIVSHYKKMFENIKPDEVIVIQDGKVAKRGDFNLLMEILEKGFDNV